MIQAQFTFADGRQVTKYVQHGDDEAVVCAMFARQLKEAWRDYLFNKYGDDWRDHDPLIGQFWKVPEMRRDT